MQTTLKHTLLAAAMVACLAFGTAGTSPNQATSADAEDGGIFVVIQNSQSLTDAIVKQSLEDPAYKSKALPILDSWTKQTSDTNPLTGDTKTVQPLAAKAAIDEIQAPSGRSLRSAPKTLSEIDPGDTGTWPVRGSAQGDRSYWVSEPAMVIEGVFCNIIGCKVTDRYTVNISITPSTTSSMYNIRTLYAPNSGKLTGARINFLAINRGVTVGKAINIQPPAPSGGTNYGYINTKNSMAGKALTIAYELNMQTPSGPTYDAAKTADCLGRSAADDPRCFY